MASDFIDLLTLVLYLLCLSAVAGGIAILYRFNGRWRWIGCILLGEGVLAGILLAVMGSQYCFTRPACVAVAQKELLLAAGKTLLAVALAGALSLATVYEFLRLRDKRRLAYGSLLLSLSLPLISIAGAMTLVVLSQPKEMPIADPEKRSLKVLPEFSASVFSKAVRNPTSITFGPDGKLYGCNLTGEVWDVSVNTVTGQADAPEIFADGFNSPVGLVWLDDRLYVSSAGKISYLEDSNADGRADVVKDIVAGLPARIYVEHQNNGLTAGPDGRLYFGVGSTTNSQLETYRYGASILSVNPDGSDLRVVATGIRNAYDLAFNAADDLFATDNGPSGFVNTPGDELNYIVSGGDFGFPVYYEYPPSGSGTLGPVVLFPAHASADGLTFYHGHQFPAEYQDNAFVAAFTRGEIYRIQLLQTPQGTYTGHAEVFASGFLNSLDVTDGPDGSLYVADFGAGAIYRLVYIGVD